MTRHLKLRAGIVDSARFGFRCGFRACFMEIIQERLEREFNPELLHDRSLAFDTK